MDTSNSSHFEAKSLNQKTWLTSSLLFSQISFRLRNLFINLIFPIEFLKSTVDKFIKFINSRRAFSIKEFFYLLQAGLYFYTFRIDPLYQGHFEKKFTDQFCSYMGGGYADAVNSGTNACYVALRALNLKKNSNVGISNFTNPGVVNAVTIAALKPIILPIVSKFDHSVDLIRMEEIIRNTKLKAIVINYAFGDIKNVNYLINLCKKYNIYLVEDISQCVGGKYLENYAGTFGAVSFCSTMGRKNLTTGSSGGLVYTKNPEIYKRILSISDRGKKIYENFSISKDTTENTEISLNFSSDEFTCAIGIASLSRLSSIVKKRREILQQLSKEIEVANLTSYIKVIPYNSKCAPFIGLIQILDDNVLKNKEKFCEELISANLPINKKYGDIAGTWDWLTPQSKKYLNLQTTKEWQNRHIVFYLHEGYKHWYIKSLASKLAKIVRKF